MFLAIDIGNSNIVFGAHNGEKWLKHWRIQTDHQKTADEYEVIFRSLIVTAGFKINGFGQVVISSVVPNLVVYFTEMCFGLFGVEPIVVGPEIYPRLPVKILNPNQIGTDLVANSVAAFTRYGPYSMVVDFGTALTFTTIGGEGEIAGVAIAPGLRTAINSLANNTAQLPYVHVAAPPSVLGENTTHAIQAGIVLGYAGLADSIIEKTQEAIGHQLTVVATGGLCKVVASLSKYIHTIEPTLTLDGIRLIGGMA